jgi:small-conductance mechanosensitive channel
VAYGTDLAKMKKLLLHLLSSDERIVPSPKPLVLIQDLNSSTIVIKILFWIENYAAWARIKSDIIEVIDEAFKREGIAISNPSQD